MAGGIGATASGTGASNVVGTAGTPSTGAGFPSNPYGGGSMPFDSTNTTTQQDMMGNRNASSGAGLNGLFSSMTQGLPTTQQTAIPPQMNNVTDIYKNVLGRDPDAGGLAYWQGQVDKGMSLADVQNSFKDTDEYKARPQLPQQMPETQPQAQQQQGQQGGKAGGYGQPQQNPYQPPAQVFAPQVVQNGGAPQPMQQAQQQASPYQVQNPYQGMMQNSYNQMMNPYMQQQQATPYQQQFQQQQYNPLSYKPNMTQSNASLSRVKPSVYNTDLATAQAKIKEYEEADAARNAAAQAAAASSGGGG